MENRSSSHKPATSLLILLILGVIILGILVALQNREIHRLGDEERPIVVEPIPTPVVAVPAPQVGSNLMVAQIAIAEKYKVTHYCDGQVDKSSNSVGAVPYCVGTSTLVFTDGDLTKIITTTTSTDVTNTPFLRDAKLIPSNTKERRMIISFSPDICRLASDTEGDCVFEAYNDPHNFIVNIGDLSVRAIKKYPGTSEAIWNASGTKALFAQVSCHEGGCDRAVLLGYDLDHDVKKAVTKEEAAFNGDLTNDWSLGPEGEYWSEVKWTSDSKFSATIINPGGTKKIVTGTF